MVTTVSLLFFKIVLRVLARAMQQEEEIKGIQIRKEQSLFLFADYMILYLLYTDYTTRKLLDLLFIQQSRILFISGHKVNIQK